MIIFSKKLIENDIYYRRALNIIKKKNKMISSFKLSKLAKEKGYKNKTKRSLRYDYYTYDGILNGDVTDYIKEYTKTDGNPEKYKVVNAPTHEELQRWLREKQYIIFYVLPQWGREIKYSYEFIILEGNKKWLYSDHELFERWDEAFDEGLIHILNEIL